MMTDPTITNEYDYGMPVHPVCNLFPLMTAPELDHLADDIRTHRLTNPLTVHNGQLVDGRNRLLACRRVGIEPDYLQWRSIYHGSETLAAWIWSINAERRHLTVDQWLAIHVEFQAFEEREAAKLRQIEGGKTAGRGRPQQVEAHASQAIAQPQRAPAVRTKLAKQLGVSEHKVQQALNVQKADPDLLKQVTSGTVKLSAAAKQIKNTTPAKKQAPPALMPADLRPIMRPVLEAVDTALRSVVTDDQRLALVKAGCKGKPTIEAWTKYLEKDKNWQREAFLKVLENWVEEFDEEDATITPVKMVGEDAPDINQAKPEPEKVTKDEAVLASGA